jgi:hypothetical protein
LYNSLLKNLEVSEDEFNAPINTDVSEETFNALNDLLGGNTDD